MKKTFTITHSNGNENMTVEAATRVEAIDIAIKRGAKDLNVVRGPRFTDSLRSKARKSLDTAAIGQVHYLGTRAAVRHLARF